MFDDLDDYPSPAELSPSEAKAYALIYDAAERFIPCPQNLDLEIAAGFNSTSMGPKLVNRLEHKGLIVVKRYQKFREVQIVATGKWTAPSESMHVIRPHVPRGARRAVATDRKPYKSRGR